MNEGEHSAHCEPNNTAAAAAHVRRDIVDRGVLGSENPLRLVADAVGDLGNDVVSTLPFSSLKRSAANAKYRERKRAYVDPEGGQVPDCRSLADLVFPNSLAHRPSGESFIIHDSGPGEDRVVMFGAEDGVRLLREATAWSADGTFKVAPRLWAQLYTAHAVTQGYFLPCAHGIDFERASIKDVQESFPAVRVAGFYSTSVSRRAEMYIGSAPARSSQRATVPA